MGSRLCGVCGCIGNARLAKIRALLDALYMCFATAVTLVIIFKWIYDDYTVAWKYGVGIPTFLFIFAVFFSSVLSFFTVLSLRIEYFTDATAILKKHLSQFDENLDKSPRLGIESLPMDEMYVQVQE